MSDMVVTLEELGGAIQAIVEEYKEDVNRAAEEDVQASAQVALDAVRGGSPTRTGKYAAGWAMEPDAEDPIGRAYRVYNRKKPGLAHLLEKGHGGPFPGRAIPHIAPAAEAGMAELERRISV